MRQSKSKITIDFYMGEALESALENMAFGMNRNMEDVLTEGLLFATKYHDARLHGKKVYIGSDGEYECIDEVADLRENYVSEFPNPFIEDDYVAVSCLIEKEQALFLSKLADKVGCDIDDLFDDAAALFLLMGRLDEKGVYIERDGYLEQIDNHRRIEDQEPNAQYVM